MELTAMILRKIWHHLFGHHWSLFAWTQDGVHHTAYIWCSCNARKATAAHGPLTTTAGEAPPEGV